MIQQPMNAAERPRTVLSILGTIQLCTRSKKSLVGNAVVSREHLKVNHQVHAPEYIGADPIWIAGVEQRKMLF